MATAVDNAAMRHVMTQLGYEPEPETFDYHAPNGDVFESVSYQCNSPAPPPRLSDTAGGNGEWQHPAE